MKKYLLLLLLMTYWSCNPDKETLVDADAFRYNTTHQSMLFFKNVRGMYYDTDKESTPHMHLYRFKDRVQDSTRILLNLLLVNHWRNEQAYVILEPNTTFNGLSPETFSLHWKDTTQHTEGTYHFPKHGNRDAHYKMATQIYNSILQKHQLFLLSSTDSIPILTTKNEREAFRVSMVDFYRVIKVF